MAEIQKSNANKSPITTIANDDIISILHFLAIDSLLAFAMTCKRFRALAYSDSLWEFICRRDWGNSVVDALISSTYVEKKLSWKKLYQKICQMNNVFCIKLFGKDRVVPHPRASHSLNLVSDCLVLFGGGCEGGRHLDDTWVTYIGSNVKKRTSLMQWQHISSGIPSGRFGHSCVVIGDALILFGGINDNGLRQNDTWIGNLTLLGSLEIKFSWKPLNTGSILPPSRGAHAACCVGDKRMVIHGGIGLDGNRLHDTWLLDISMDCGFATWQEIIAYPSLPARSGSTLSWIGKSCVILFGGRGSGYEVLSDIWLLDLASEYPKWVELRYESPNKSNEAPLPRVGHSATPILGGQFLIYGGEDSNWHRKDDCWLLDPKAVHEIFNSNRFNGKLWKRMKIQGVRPGFRSFHQACADQSGKFVYVFGGMVDGIVRPFEPNGLTFDGEMYLLELML